MMTNSSDTKNSLKKDNKEVFYLCAVLSVSISILGILIYLIMNLLGFSKLSRVLVAVPFATSALFSLLMSMKFFSKSK